MKSSGKDLPGGHFDACEIGFAVLDMPPVPVDHYAHLSLRERQMMHVSLPPDRTGKQPANEVYGCNGRTFEKPIAENPLMRRYQ